MGVRYRKSINLGGGFRVNLSQNGVGYSWGVKGYRITKTADGRTRRTVSIPGTGISYVDEHKDSTRQQQEASRQVDPLDAYSDIQEVHSAGTEALRPAEYSELFVQVKQFKMAVIILFIMALWCLSDGLLCLLPLVGIVFLFVKYRASIEYEFDDYELEKWQEFRAAWAAVASSQSLQQITLKAKSKNARVTGGIENAIQTEKMSASSTLPWYIKSNIKPVVFSFKNMLLAIMPDRLLVFDKKMGALDYNDVTINLSAVGFLESGKVPSDSEIVKHVWAYSNKDGSPDKRYSNNKQYPVMKYGKIVITSESGLNIQFLCSDEAAADNLNELINNK